MIDETPMTETISIVVGGDFCPTEHVEEAVSRLPRPGDLLGPAAELFQKADLAIANLEYPLTRAEKKCTKYGPNMKGDPDTISVLEQSGIGLVDLANNHILDYGEKGLTDTLETCAKANIATVGAGLTAKEASQPYCVTIKGRKIAVIGICESEFSVFGEGHGGTCPLDLIANYRAIKEARKEADIVVVLFHGGNMCTHYPSPRVVETCRFFADVGASAVVCHHPHYIQGSEVYNGVPILYSLGKLLYTRAGDPDMLEVPVAELKFSLDDLKCSVHFDFFQVSLEQMRVVELNAEELCAARERFATYSQMLESRDALLAEWNRFCESKTSLYYRYLLSIPTLALRIARRMKLDGLLTTYARFRRTTMLCLEDMMRCEAHRDALLNILEREREE